MTRMDSRMVALAALAVLGGALAGCGGEAKAPSTCPEGTRLKGSDCVPDDSSSDDSVSSSSPASASKGGEDEKGSAAGGGGGTTGAGDDSAATGATPYDKDAVYVQLKRAARQVKGNCGAATDDTGLATGPWGQTKVSVVLGRNGHVKKVTVPAPYDGKPVGVCVEHAFQKLVFPPYGAPSDAILDWDIEVTQPRK